MKIWRSKSRGSSWKAWRCCIVMLIRAEHILNLVDNRLMVCFVRRLNSVFDIEVCEVTAVCLLFPNVEISGARWLHGKATCMHQEGKAAGPPGRRFAILACCCSISGKAHWKETYWRSQIFHPSWPRKNHAGISSFSGRLLFVFINLICFNPLEQKLTNEDT